MAKNEIRELLVVVDRALTQLRTKRESAWMAWYSAPQGTPKNKAERAYHGVLGAVRELTEQRLRLRRMLIFG
jgi:hypothetical protein